MLNTMSSFPAFVVSPTVSYVEQFDVDKTISETKIDTIFTMNRYRSHSVRQHLYIVS